MGQALLSPNNSNELTCDVTKPICYILPNRSLTDALVLDKACLTHHLPRPIDPIKPSRFNEKRALVSLERHIGLFKRERALPKLLNRFKTKQQVDNVEKGDQNSPLPPSPKPLETSKGVVRLHRLVDHLMAHPEDDIQIVPISIFWGRSPEKDKKEASFWKVAFSDTWAVPSALRKMIMIMLHGRSTLIQFSDPISLQQLVQEGLPPERTTRKLLRILRVHFRRQRETVVGPDLSHRRTMANHILNSKDVRHAIANDVRTNNTAYRIASQRARHYANEVAADYSYAVIRSLDHVLNWLWNQIYNGVEVYNVDNLKRIANEYEIVYVPCHRSHIDYLLLSFVVYKHGLVPPHIAAGVNLNLPILGSILRRGGAFFMRRSFKGNELYAAVFNEYLHIILKRGFSIEYFIEGGRSRTGRLMHPKKGMLSMTAQSYLRDARRPIMFVPVYIGYERLFEGSSYIHELYGKKKQKESLLDLLRSFRKLNQNYGKVHVNFGRPVLIDDVLDQHNPNWRQAYPNSNSAASTKNDWLSKPVNQLAQQIMTEINASAVINPINLISVALLATPKQSMDEGALISQIDLYRSLLKKCPYSSNTVLVKFNGLEAIEQCESMTILHRRRHPLGDLLYLDQENAVLLTYFRNNVLHLFAIPSLIACFSLHNFAVDPSRILKFIEMVYPFLKSELFLHWDRGRLESIVSQRIESMVELGLLVITEQPDARVRAPSTSTPEYLKLLTLSYTAHQPLERHFMTLALLLKHGSDALTPDELEEQCYLMAQRLSFLFEFNAPEFFDKKLFRNFIETLRGESLLTLSDEGKLLFDQTLETLYTETRHVLSSEVRQAIRQVTHKVT